MNLLGGFSLTAAGVEVPLTTRKDRLLLAFLTLNARRSLARERLAGLLWGDRGEAQARDSLRQSLAAIRQAFRRAGLEPLAADREAVTFDTGGIACDVEAFVAAAEAGDAGQAARLYAGELLDGVDSATPEYDAWLGPERARLGQIAARVVETCALSGACAPDTLALARRLMARDPSNEAVCRALMRMQVAAGDRAAALKLYGACRDALQRELGVAPDLQTSSLYRDILTDRDPVAGNPAPADGDSEATRPSIAVLPFDNISRDPQLDHLAEGIAEDIITGLGRFRLLFVIDRYSSSAIARQSQDIAEIGRRLGAAQLVQGSLQRLGERLRITVRLVDSASRAQLWAESFDSDLAEIASMPDRITGAIVASLHARVEFALTERSKRRPKLAAYECLLRGIKHLRGYAPGDNDAAVELFRRAVELDPDYALAHAYLGFGQVVRQGYDDAPRETLVESRRVIETAVRLDDHEGRCHWLLGMVCGYLGDIKAEERHILRARALNPNDANFMATHGAVAAILGRHEEGLSLVREAMRRNPYHPEWYWISIANILYRMGRFDDALEAYRHRTGPGYWVLSRIAACHAQLGQAEEARQVAAEVLRLKPDFSVARLRHAGWTEDDTRRVQDGLRKAGLPE